MIASWNSKNFSTNTVIAESQLRSYTKYPALGIWAGNQRQQYQLLQLGKKSLLTQDRVDCLNGIQFECVFLNLLISVKTTVIGPPYLVLVNLHIQDIMHCRYCRRSPSGPIRFRLRELVHQIGGTAGRRTGRGGRGGGPRGAGGRRTPQRSRNRPEDEEDDDPFPSRGATLNSGTGGTDKFREIERVDAVVKVRFGKIGTNKGQVRERTLESEERGRKRHGQNRFGPRCRRATRKPSRPARNSRQVVVGARRTTL